MKAILDVDELCSDSNFITGSLYATFEHCTDIELFANLANIHSLVAKLKGRCARRDANFAYLREHVQDRVGQAVRKIGAALVVAHIDERQYRDRRRLFDFLSGNRRRVLGDDLSRGRRVGYEKLIDQQHANGNQQHTYGDAIEPLTRVAGN